MAKSKKIGIVIACDGEKQFVQQVQNANKQTSALKAEMKKLVAEFDENANSMEYLTKKQNILTRQQSAYTDKLNAAQKGLKTAESNLDNQWNCQEKCSRINSLNSFSTYAARSSSCSVRYTTGGYPPGLDV